MMTEVTTADELNALVQFFERPQLYIEAGVALLAVGLIARMKRQGARATSMSGRLGLVIHWASLLVALLLLVVGAFFLATQSGQADTPLFVGVSWAAALIVWLIGKSLRFILTGPLSATEAPSPQDQRTREKAPHLSSNATEHRPLPTASSRSTLPHPKVRSPQQQPLLPPWTDSVIYAPLAVLLLTLGRFGKFDVGSPLSWLYTPFTS